MYENHLKEKEIKKLVKSVEAHIRNSHHFERTIKLLLKEEEESVFYKDFRVEHPKGKKPLSTLIIEEKDKFSELEQKVLTMVSKFLKILETDYKEIELLQDTQREIRVKEFKDMLFEKLVSLNALHVLMNDDYKELFEIEMKKYYSL